MTRKVKEIGISLVGAWGYMTENQISANYRYIESIRNMRKPVISSEISLKFGRVLTTYTLPDNKLSEITK